MSWIDKGFRGLLKETGMDHWTPVEISSLRVSLRRVDGATFTYKGDAVGSEWEFESPRGNMKAENLPPPRHVPYDIWDAALHTLAKLEQVQAKPSSGRLGLLMGT